MKKKIEIINFTESLTTPPSTDENVWTTDMMVVLDSNKAVHNPQDSIGQPYLIIEGRLIRIISGNATLVANLQAIKLHSEMVVCLPPNTIIQYEQISNDFRLQSVSYKNIPTSLSFDKVTSFTLGDNDFERIGDYFHLLLQVVRKKHFSHQTINHLLMALFNDLHHIEITSKECNTSSQARNQENIFNRFIDLVNKFGATERRIDFYASQLLLSPNHLSTLIKSYSGQTVMDWVNRATLLQAKILLRHTNLMSYEIAYRLNFSEPTAFNRYFKQHTGITPMQYRKE